MSVVLRWLKKIAVLIMKQDELFEWPVENQKDFLNNFGTPKDDIERSYYQYLCQAKLNGLLMSCILNIASLPMIIYYSVKKENIQNTENVDAVFVSEGISECVIPFELRNCLISWKIINELKEYYTSEDRSQFIKLFKRYPFSWYFLFKCLLKIRIYSYLVHSYEPKAIVVCSEYSFTSSFLTSYCESQERLHINIMHGEKLFYIRDSFFRFHRCYIWSNFYIKLFEVLKADKKQFIISLPQSMLLGDGSKHYKEVDYTYYLGRENKIILIAILNALQKLKEKGFMVAIRPHPRYSNINEIRSIFYSSNIEIECIDKIPISKSILRTKNVVSLYSTVLNQAYHSNVCIVIDNVSNPQRYLKLKDLQYIMLEMNHKLLSTEIRG